MRMQIKYTVLLLAALVAFPFGVLTAQETSEVPSAKGAVTDAAGEPLFQVLITDSAGKMLGTAVSNCGRTFRTSVSARWVTAMSRSPCRLI